MEIDSPVFPCDAGLLYINMNGDVSGQQSGMEVCYHRSMFDADARHAVIRFSVCLLSTVVHTYSTNTSRDMRQGLC